MHNLKHRVKNVARGVNTPEKETLRQLPDFALSWCDVTNTYQNHF